MENNRSSTLVYLGYVFLLLIMVFFGLKFQASLYLNSQETYKIFPYFLFKAIFPLIIGVYLAAPHLYKTFTKAGKWKVDWVKLIVVGLPFIYLSIVPILYFSEVIALNLPFSSYAMGGYFGGDASTSFGTINGIIAGYIVPSSIKK
ncbi:hypothetical protein M3175_10415 [Robertmurraya korlensis]|uniref:hypothetical protein n=1 Tax=Robertmurraya korlensis TaxID=519977 RepID=UPI00203FE2F3|nr:hypothetical protein [Robertmurraya korlensis]MCM3601143.1 hypothetical protein [Robertmurraya korlensis]